MAKNRFFPLIGLCLLLSAQSAHAEPFTLAPTGCDFQITFPEKPYRSEKCDEVGARCYAVNNFTRVFDLHTTVNFRITCNPSPEGALERYSGETLKTVLKGMIDNNTITEYDLHFNESEKTKLASLTGTGKVGLTPMIYTAQIWVGPNSLFTMEGELIGKGSTEADDLFAGIISSIRTKEAEKDASEAEAKPEE